MEVDETLLTQEVIETGLSDAVTAGKALQRDHLVVAIMVNVCVGMRREVVSEEIQDTARCFSFFLAVLGPDRLETARAMLFKIEAEQLLKATFHIGISLDIKEQVVRRGTGQAQETAVRLNGPQFEARL